MTATPPRNLGSIYTPPDFARLLSSWAVQDKRDRILDIGVGEGVFTFAAHERLVNLGASASIAQRQIHGAEIYKPAYEAFTRHAAQRQLSFPQIHRANFFSIDFPLVDAALGNPPYVRRALIKNINGVRRKVLTSNLAINEQELSRLTDLYIYFLLQAASRLRDGGRLAVITADSWLNARYGQIFKKILKENFEVECLIGLDRQVFDSAQVKPVLLFATKRESRLTRAQVRFIRVKNGLPASDILRVVNNSTLNHPDVMVASVRPQSLETVKPWGQYLKAPKVFEEMAAHPLMTQLKEVASTIIGIQTLAQDFFVLTPERAAELQLEAEFLAPLALSSQYYPQPTIEVGRSPAFYLFCCAKTKNQIQGSYALRYIRHGENITVPVRGKNVSVKGYHKKERIKRAGRPRWYDLCTALNERGRAEILIPRLISKSFQVVWNQAGFVPGELFIECRPRVELSVEIEVYLAVLTSSLTEFFLRSQAQLYGGGAYNISPGKIGETPVLNLGLLTDRKKMALKEAYLTYLADPLHDRSIVDREVYNILGLSADARQRLNSALTDLVGLTTVTRHYIEDAME